MMFWTKSTSTTTKSRSILRKLGYLPNSTDSRIFPFGWIESLVNPASNVLIGLRFAHFKPSFKNVSQLRTLTLLMVSTSTRLTTVPLKSIAITRASR